MAVCDRPRADHFISLCFSPVCSFPVWGNSSDHPFYHSLNARGSFPASLKCAKASWLEQQASAVWCCEGSLPLPWDELWEAPQDSPGRSCLCFRSSRVAGVMLSLLCPGGVHPLFLCQSLMVQGWIWESPQPETPTCGSE